MKKLRHKLSLRFHLSVSHTLQRDIDAEGSKRIHGHTYWGEVTIEKDPDPDSGMIMDIAHFRNKIEGVREILDHRLLDEVPDLGPATVENLCTYVFRYMERQEMPVIRVSFERPETGERCVVEY